MISKRGDPLNPDQKQTMEFKNTASQVFGLLLLAGGVGYALVETNGGFTANHYTPARSANTPPTPQALVDQEYLTMRWGCEKALKATLRDPDSYQAKRVQMVPSKRAGALVDTVIEFRSRNGFGGMAQGLANCSFNNKAQLVSGPVMTRTGGW